MYPATFRVVRGGWNGSGPHVTVADHDPFRRGEPFQTYRSAGMDFIGTDPDFGAEPILKAIGKAGGRVDHDRTRIDFGDKSTRSDEIFRYDRIGMLRSITANVLHRLVDPFNDP